MLRQLGRFYRHRISWTLLATVAASAEPDPAPTTQEDRTMYVIDHSSLAKASLPGIQHQTLACAAQGLEQLSLWRQSMAGGSATPPHRHDCEEVVVVLAGRGRVHIAGVVHDFGPDTTLVIPAGVDHQIFSTGDEPLQTIAAFPATPVQVTLPDGTPFDLPWES
jgi:mannose-6-phosphate isomerase-like protein (cupin superfamily)